MQSKGFPGFIRPKAQSLKPKTIQVAEILCLIQKPALSFYTPASYIDREPLLLQPGNRSSGRSVARSSRLVWDQEVASSNLAAPTNRKTNPLRFSGGETIVVYSVMATLITRSPQVILPPRLKRYNPPQADNHPHCQPILTAAFLNNWF